MRTAPKPTPAAGYVSVFEFAAHFDINPATVRRMIARGEIEAVRVGRTVRIPKSAFAAFPAA